MLRFVLTSTVLLLGVSVSFADHGRRELADKHGPAGIIGDHIHRRGEWMVEYKYMNMFMEDNRLGKNTISDEAAIGPLGGPAGIAVDGIQTNVEAAPTQMTMQMHMAHIMYGATDDISLYTVVMLPSLSMDHVRGDANPAGRGSAFTTQNSGLGDTALGALLRLASDCDEDLLFNLGCSVPTGDIYDESSAQSGGFVSQPLSYPMRLGSGTFNFRPGLTYRQFYDWWSWGGQVQADLPIGMNYRGYSVGEEVRLNSWTSVLLTDLWAVSWRGEHVFRANYDGADPDLSDLSVSTNVEKFRGGYWYSAGFGTQVLLTENLLSFEFVPTIGQSLDGIQLETDYAVVASWAKSW
jgi:hypothetical protein